MRRRMQFEFRHLKRHYFLRVGWMNLPARFQPQPGSITLEVNGLGSLQAVGLPPAASYQPASPMTATIGSAPAAVSFLSLAPSAIGVYKITVVVPKGLALGENTLVLATADSQTSQTTIAVGAGSASRLAWRSRWRTARASQRRRRAWNADVLNAARTAFPQTTEAEQRRVAGLSGRCAAVRKRYEAVCVPPPAAP